MSAFVTAISFGIYLLCRLIGRLRLSRSTRETTAATA
ncbi:hypothetical protein SAMN04489718_2809 [Actinopolyspora saharensis]|uniref:Uncharacterized protein n=1 Tax=Actinopolyspora saharensis TaxID=995062 RepID=A0A1H1F397_9ACTN|nr:hypothetical protein SAMN04489718_2809 [Actinopolyspora saharensis]